MSNPLVLIPRNAPYQVQVSLSILWVDLIVGSLHSVFGSTPPLPSSLTSGSALPLTILLLASSLGEMWIFLKIAEGRVWARNAMCVMAVLSLLSLTNVSSMINLGGRFAAAFAVLSVAGYAVATAVLMHAPKTFWKAKS
jgi:hypothetical protein